MPRRMGRPGRTRRPTARRSGDPASHGETIGTSGLGPAGRFLAFVAEAVSLAWTQHLYLDGDLAIAEPKRLRYCLLHAAGMIVHTGRQTKLRLADDCPWTDALIAAFDRLHHRPARC